MSFELERSNYTLYRETHLLRVELKNMYVTKVNCFVSPVAERESRK